MHRLRAAIGLILFATAWQVLSGHHSLLLPSLLDIFDSIFVELSHGRLLRDIAHSAFRVITGVGIATLLALLLGIISGFFRTFPDYLKGIVEIVRPIPPIAWTPVVIILFGIGTIPAIVIVTLGAFFPAWFGVLQGIKEIKLHHLQAAKSLGANRWLILTDIMIPSALPYFIHGIRLAVGIGWFCVVAAEMMGSSSGLGYRIQLASLNLEMERLYAYLFAIGLTGYASNTLLYVMDRKFGRSRND